jgi:aerotaxis receptor
MKLNLPVTDHEVMLEQGKPLVSKTDLKGIITYANQAFVEISGYSADELVGRNHNIVRHPDMPPAAFADLWATIGQGRPWRGLVKNRSKNGDYYWVEAYVTPIVQEGKTIGYMSVRNIPSREEVYEAESLYREMRSGRVGLPRRVPSVANIPFMLRLWFFFGTLTAMFAFLASAQHGVGLAVAMSGGLMALASGFWMTFYLKRFIARLNYFADRVEEGDLAFSIRTEDSDEPGQLLNRMESLRINLRAIIADSMLVVHGVKAGVERLETSASNILSDLEEQNDRIVGAASALEQINSSIQSAGEHTRESERIAGQAESTVRSSNEQIGKSMESMAGIVKAVEASRETIVKLGAEVQQIERITTAIRDIADQTNLLSLNAAIEAARAGPQGSGFAVVADEVRQLSDRTATSTVSISQTVDGILKITRTATRAMEHAMHEVESGNSKIREGSEYLDVILQASSRSAVMAKEIALMLRQLGEAAELIASNIHEISGLSDSNARHAQRTRDTASQALMTVNSLHGLLGHFERSL